MYSCAFETGVNAITIAEKARSIDSGKTFFSFDSPNHGLLNSLIQTVVNGDRSHSLTHIDVPCLLLAPHVQFRNSPSPALFLVLRSTPQSAPELAVRPLVLSTFAIFLAKPSPPLLWGRFAKNIRWPRPVECCRILNTVVGTSQFLKLIVTSIGRLSSLKTSLNSCFFGRIRGQTILLHTHLSPQVHDLRGTAEAIERCLWRIGVGP